jgi:hypothetical protein
MNVYVVVEGRVVEKAVYTVWIPKVNSALTPAAHIGNVTDNNFLIVSSNGYPAYFETIEAGLADVATSGLFDRLVISIDSEDMTLQEKYDEVDDFVRSTPYASIDYRIVVQHFCFEAWALGNRKIGSRKPQNQALLKYRRVHNVVTHDPELLPSLPDESLNRSQFAEKYLRLTLNDRNKRLTYSKNNPRVVAHPKYYEQLVNRMADTDHINSFRAFVEAFV